MKKSSAKSNRKAASDPRSLLARAAAAKQRLEAARKSARAAKAKFREARKAFKHAKRLAKQARKEAKAAMKAFVNRRPRAPKKQKPKKKATARMRKTRTIAAPPQKPTASLTRIQSGPQPAPPATPGNAHPDN